MLSASALFVSRACHTTPNPHDEAASAAAAPQSNAGNRVVAGGDLVVIREEPETPMLCHQGTGALSIPIEIRGEIAGFSARNDILNLRATHPHFKSEVDVAITSLRLTGCDQINAFTAAADFQHLRTLKIHGVDDTTLKGLAVRLATFRPNRLRLSLMSTAGPVVDALKDIGRLPLGTLLLGQYDHPEDHGFSALTTSSFPVELTGSLSQHALKAAADIRTLSVLCNCSLDFDDSAAACFHGHSNLTYLCFYANPRITSRGIATLAAMPALCDFVLYDTNRMRHPPDATALGAMASNRSLRHLYIETRDETLTEEAFEALSHSQTLTLVRLPICPGMQAIADIRTLKHVFLTGKSEASPAIDRVLTCAILSLPLLESLTLRSVSFEDDSLLLLLRQSRAKHLHLSDIAITNEAVTALLSNAHVETVRLDRTALSPKAVAALKDHAKITHLLVDGKLERTDPAITTT